MDFFTEERLVEANSLLRKVISHTLQEEGKDATKIGTAKNNLGMVYYNQGNFKAAKKILTSVYEQDLVLFGRLNFNSIIDGLNLAWAEEGLYELEASIKMYRDCWKASFAELGEDHPTTLLALSSMSWYGVAYEVASSHSAEETLRLTELALGQQHPDTITPRAAVTWRLIDCGQLHDARILAGENFSVAQDYFGPNHSQTGICELDVVATLSPNDPEAYAVTIRAFEKIYQALGKNHIDTARAVMNLGFIMSHRGQLMEAQDALRNAQILYSRMLPPNHPDRTASALSLELIQYAIKKSRTTEFLSRLSRKPHFRRYIPSPTL